MCCVCLGWEGSGIIHIDFDISKRVCLFKSHVYLAWKNLKDRDLMEFVHTQTRRETVLIAGGGRTLKGEIERESGQAVKRVT